MSTPKIIAGGTLSRGGAGGLANRSRGTATMVVSDGTDHYALTCAHVMGFVGIDPTMSVVYSPEYKECCLGIALNHEFGNVVTPTLDQQIDRQLRRIQKTLAIGAQTFAIDAAVIKLTPAAKWSNQVDDARIGMITGVRDLTTELADSSYADNATLASKGTNAPLTIKVKKYGSITDFTSGTVTRLQQVPTWSQPSPGADMVEGTGYLFQIDVDPSVPSKTFNYTLDMPRLFEANPSYTSPQAVADDLNSTPGKQLDATITGTADQPVLTITGRVFSLPGDSGSPIVDESSRVLGILTAGYYKAIYEVGKSDSTDIFTGSSLGVFIQPALTRLGQLASATYTFAPGASSAGMLRPVPGGTSPVELVVSDSAALARAEADLGATPVGARLIAFLRRHLSEIRDLVHHRRRVTVAWHRMKGPGFVAAILRGSLEPGWPLRAQIEGIAIGQALATMRAVLAAESPRLAEAIAVDADALAAFVAAAEQATSIDELIARLGGP